MSRINIIIPAIKSDKFTGGTLCILEHAAQLTSRGHDVCIIPVLPSPYPTWFPKNLGNFVVSGKKDAFHKALRALYESIKCIPSMKTADGKVQLMRCFSGFIENTGLIFFKLTPLSVRMALRFSYVRQHIREADVTIATSYETVLPTALAGTGKLLYFMQHYEPYFKEESIDPYLSEKESLLSYRLGFGLIANSPWLQQKVEQEHDIQGIHCCPNAINHELFKITPDNHQAKSSGNSIRIISYGGRDAKWKGFLEMAEAVKIARQILTDIEIIWQVYGGALLPANNHITSYQDLGFLPQTKLADAYRQADILLSASWYESFPLFPLEAMACGLAVISTQAGTENFCIHGETAEIVPARNPQSIASAIIRLIETPSYRKQLAQKGSEKALTFTWENAGNTMNKIITGYLANDSD